VFSGELLAWRVRWRVVKKATYKNLPDSPGVYIMKGARGSILYVGKAGNLRRRVASYFLPARNAMYSDVGGRPHDARIQKLVSEIRNIDYRRTDTAMEALILEAELIKRYKPPYNVREKDDTSFLYIEVTKEKFPRVLLVRGKSETLGKRFGPFTSSSNVRQAVSIIRRIFPFSIHPANKVDRAKRGCFDYQIGLCPGTCLGAVSREEYLKNIKNIKLFLRGGKKKILTSLEKEMRKTSKNLEFESALKIRRQIFALRHIQDVAFVTEPELNLGEVKPLRLEGYDVSNISGTSAVGSMVVFAGDEPVKSEYRKFKIKTISGPDDVGMMKEVIRRRFSRIPPQGSWLLPDLILVDGGKPQVNAAKGILDESGVKIPVIGIAKGPERKKNEFVGRVPKEVGEKTLIKLRDEAHRFAISYHKNIRSKNFVR